jgi:hypothetical protein
MTTTTARFDQPVKTSGNLIGTIDTVLSTNHDLLLTLLTGPSTCNGHVQG